jgi:hypothetical protein
MLGGRGPLKSGAAGVVSSGFSFVFFKSSRGDSIAAPHESRTAPLRDFGETHHGTTDRAVVKKRHPKAAL